MNDDVSVSESSWADAQADTPTMGEGGSDSEVNNNKLNLHEQIERAASVCLLSLLSILSP